MQFQICGLPSPHVKGSLGVSALFGSGMLLRGEGNRVRSAIERHRHRRIQKYIFEPILLPVLRFPSDGTWEPGAGGLEGRMRAPICMPLPTPPPSPRVALRQFVIRTSATWRNRGGGGMEGGGRARERKQNVIVFGRLLAISRPKERHLPHIAARFQKHHSWLLSHRRSHMQLFDTPSSSSKISTHVGLIS